MDAEEILNRLIDNNPELAEQIKKISQPEPKKKRGRPKKNKTEQPKSKNEDGLFRVDNNIKRNTGSDPQKNYTKAEDVSEIHMETHSDNNNDIKEYYNLRPTEKKLYKQKPIPRTRKNKMVTKKCEECKKTVEVAPILAAASYFRCDRCLAGMTKKNYE